jgi:hypothetical protein
MRYLVLAAIALLTGCSDSPPSAATASPAHVMTTTGSPVMQGVRTPSGTTTRQPVASAIATPAPNGAIAIPEVDPGSPFPRLVINDLQFNDTAGTTSASAATNGVPNINPNALPVNRGVNPNATPVPAPTPMMQLMPSAMNAMNSSLPILLGVGHGNGHIWALVNDNAHAILQIGDKIQNTRVTEISDDGVRLADGRLMTVQWNGMSGSSMTINGVPNIDTNVPQPGAPVTSPPVTTTSPPTLQQTPVPAPPIQPAQTTTGTTIVPAAPIGGASTINQTLPGLQALPQNTPAAPTVLH